MVNFGLLTAEICWRVWGIPADFNGFRVLAALLHGTLVVGVSQTFRRWTEGATYTRQGGHHVGHWPTFLVTQIVLQKTNFTMTSARVWQNAVIHTDKFLMSILWVPVVTLPISSVYLWLVLLVQFTGCYVLCLKSSWPTIFFSILTAPLWPGKSVSWAKAITRSLSLTVVVVVVFVY